MSNRPITQQEIEEAINKLRYPKPVISSEEATKIASELFLSRPAWNHCAPSTVKALQKAYDLPGGDIPFWIATGFRGGVCIGEICGAISGGVICLGLMAYKKLKRSTEHEERISCQALKPYIWDLIYVFNRKFGSIHCSTLTGQYEMNEIERDIYSRTWYGKEHLCKIYVEFVVKTIVRWGEVSIEPPKPVPPGAKPPTFK